MFRARNPYFHSADGIELVATLKIGFVNILMRIMHGRLNLTRCGASNEFGVHGLQSLDACGRIRSVPRYGDKIRMLAESLSVTVGALAKAAGVSVETVRYFQRRGLFATPPKGGHGFRRYGPEALERLRGSPLRR